MRVTCTTELSSLSTTHKAFDTLSKIYGEANAKSNTRMTFNLDKASHGDGNLSAVCASISFMLGKSENSLDIGPRKHGYNKVKVAKDMFGYRCSSYAFQRLTFWSNGTEVRIFEANRFIEFSEYLVKEAIRSDWRNQIPVHYMLDVKDFLRKLYRNCSEHMDSSDPIFLSSSFKNNILTFTIADCGVGFRNQFVLGDDRAITITSALNGKSAKGDGLGGTLKELGDYCWFNSGSLLVVSGNSSVEYKEDGIHEVRKLSAPIRGSIVSFSVKIEMQKFSDDKELTVLCA